VQFRKAQRKDAVMREHLSKFDKDEGVVFVGKAQEKTPVFRTERRRSPKTGLPYPWLCVAQPWSTTPMSKRWIVILARSS
jgi:hypothetical protein